MTTTTKNSKSFIAGLLTATAASLCCITPVLALLGGASGLASSFSWIEPFRPYLIGLTVLFFAFAWYQKLKPQIQVDCDCEADNKKSFWQSKSFLGIVTVVSGLLISFPYYAKAFYPKPQEIKVVVVDKTNIQQAVFKIKGMTCESCTQHVNTEISKVKGIIAFQTSYENANSTVKFDSSKTSIDSIAAAISSTGYKVISQTVTNN
ncbi:MAG: mercuric transport protein MerTP [Spirosoma sp.]|nr:mercuric transport protein MerTP [Spirosoma sp.]